MAATVLSWTLTVRPFQAKWRGSTPRRSNFQSIYLGGSFTDAPCKPHNWPLQSPRATGPIPPPTFKTEPPPHFRETTAVSLPHGIALCSFRFCERVSLPPPHGRISVL
ncbi:hypothetical protein AVEN_88102-1 [Araneus ventricosus]|uniref:Uncharacterized protein n=1 Tax=Araneus ventricosus TaxID=182803 RepID=A0A4Y2KVX1_ARAVE|nr:hypothetical protein AVEN_88102-1 [Araneus ventricosus]